MNNSHEKTGITQRIGDDVRHIQTGRVQNYFLGLIGGLVVLILVYRTVWLG